MRAEQFNCAMSPEESTDVFVVNMYSKYSSKRIKVASCFHNIINAKGKKIF